MSEIVSIEGDTVKIGEQDGTVLTVALASLQYLNPTMGDKVRVYKDGKKYYVRREESITGSIINLEGGQRSINKIAYLLVVIILGNLGVHRFMRGQIGIGVAMLLLNWLTFGIWWLIDVIISLAKLADYRGDNYVFTMSGEFAAQSV